MSNTPRRNAGLSKAGDIRSSPGTMAEPIEFDITDDESTNSAEPKNQVNPPLPPYRQAGSFNFFQRELPPYWHTWISETTRMITEGTEFDPIVRGNGVAKLEDFKRLFQIAAPKEDEQLNGWLNDEIINAFIGVLQEHLNPKEAPLHLPQHIFLSTFTTARIQTRFGIKRDDRGAPVLNKNKQYMPMHMNWGEMSQNMHTAELQVLKMSKIQRGGEIWSIDCIYLPFHLNRNHWVLVMARPRRKRFDIYDSLQRENWDGPVDAIANHFVYAVRRWISWVANGTAHPTEKEWKIGPSPGPVQANGKDCGVFVCTSMLCIARNIHPSGYTIVDEKVDGNGPGKGKKRTASQVDNDNNEEERTTRTTSQRQREYIAAVIRQGRFGGDLPFEP